VQVCKVMSRSQYQRTFCENLPKEISKEGLFVSFANKCDQFGWNLKSIRNLLKSDVLEYLRNATTYQDSLLTIWDLILKNVQEGEYGITASLIENLNADSTFKHIKASHFMPFLELLEDALSHTGNAESKEGSSCSFIEIFEPPLYDPLSLAQVPQVANERGREAIVAQNSDIGRLGIDAPSVPAFVRVPKPRNAKLKLKATSFLNRKNDFVDMD